MFYPVNETLDVDETHTVNISGPDTTQWVLHNLMTDSQYKFYLSACTLVACGPPISEEGDTARLAREYTCYSYCVLLHRSVFAPCISLVPCLLLHDPQIILHLLSPFIFDYILLVQQSI